MLKPVKEKSSLSIMQDILLCLLVLEGMAVYYYGIRAVITALIAGATAFICDIICIRARELKPDIRDLSAIISGLTLALMLPASVPYYVIVISTSIAVLIGKHAFGGKGSEIFSGAAVGYVFSEISFPDAVLLYPRPFDNLSLSLAVDNTLYQSFSKTMINATSTTSTDFELLLGKFTGPMGTGFVILLAVMGIYLALRRSISGTVLFSELSVFALFSYIFNGFSINAVKYDMVSGMLLFGAIFLSAVYPDLPSGRSDRIIYGIITGIFLCIFRYYALTENPIVYAVILAAPIGIAADSRRAEKQTKDASSVKNNEGETANG